MKGVASWALGAAVLVVVGVSLGVSQQPDCARPCAGLPDVSQEVRRIITDDGETCTLDPKYQQCILDECQTSSIPQAMRDYFKDNYSCDLSSASRGLFSVVTLTLALTLALLLK